MAAVPLVRPLLAAAVLASSACTLWAALDDPYKSEASESSDAGLPPVDAAADTAEAAGPVGHLGFVPYAIAAYGDTVYAVDRDAVVHVATDAGTSFTRFWANDAGDIFLAANRIAASSAGVFWTVDKGIRYCALDGGACGLQPHGGSPGLIAAGDSVVAWTDNARDGGIGRCTIPLPCAPVPTFLGEPATSIAVEPDGTVAWATGGKYIGFVGGSRPRTILPVADHAVALVASDVASGDLYWIGKDGIGIVPFDGGAGSDVTLGGTVPPSQFFVREGVGYWTVPLPGAASIASTAFEYCAFSSRGACNPRPVAGNVSGDRPDLGLVVTSRDVLTVLSFAVGQNPQLYAWPVP